MKKYLLFLVLPILLNSCKDISEEKETKAFVTVTDNKKIEQLAWLLGDWSNQSEESFSQENWSQENDSTFTAYSFVEVNGEVVFAETMALERKGEEVFLTVASVDEDDNTPVTFKMTFSDGRKFIFENDKNKFPSKITYTNKVMDSLYAVIEGTVNDQPKKSEFSFSRKRNVK